MKNWIAKHCSDIILSIGIVLTPVIPVLLTVGVMVAADFIFAIYRQYKQDPSQITSRKMSNTITKLLTYTIFIMVIFLFEKYVITDIVPITKIASTLICLTEIKSIDETFYLLNGYSLWDKITSILRRGQSTTKGIIDEVEKKD
jgi:hypothetical protein